MYSVATQSVLSGVASWGLSNPSLEKGVMVAAATLITTTALRCLHKAYCKLFDKLQEEESWNRMSFPVTVLTFGVGFFVTITLQKKFLTRDQPHKLAESLLRASPSLEEVFICKGFADSAYFIYGKIMGFSHKQKVDE